MASKAAAAAAQPVPAGHPVLCPEVVELARALVCDGDLIGRDALVMIAPAAGNLWRWRGGPAAVEADPEAYPIDRCLLYALGENVPPPVGLTVKGILSREETT